MTATPTNVIVVLLDSLNRHLIGAALEELDAPKEQLERVGVA